MSVMKGKGMTRTTGLYWRWISPDGISGNLYDDPDSAMADAVRYAAQHFGRDRGMEHILIEQARALWRSVRGMGYIVMPFQVWIRSDIE